MLLKDAIDLVVEEYISAAGKFPPFYSAHEGWGIIREEYLELEDEIMRKDRDIDQMRKEAMHLAAMALRFIIDVT